MGRQKIRIPNPDSGQEIGMGLLTEILRQAGIENRSGRNVDMRKKAPLFPSVLVGGISDVRNRRLSSLVKCRISRPDPEAPT
jgi:hypothetical protein